MRSLFLVVALVIGALILLTLIQAARADTILDRLLNIALAAANALVLLVLIGFVFERPAFFGDVGLAYALLAFLFPLAFAKYLESEGGGLPDLRRTVAPRPTGPAPAASETPDPGSTGPAPSEGDPGAAPGNAGGGS